MGAFNIRNHYNITIIALVFNLIATSVAVFTNSFVILGALEFGMTFLVFILSIKRRIDLTKYLVIFLIMILVFVGGWYLVKHEINYRLIEIYVVQLVFLLTSKYLRSQSSKS